MSTARRTPRTTTLRARRRRVPAAALGGLLLVLGLLAGCGNGEPTLPAATRTADAAVGTVSAAPDGVQEITLETGDDYVFTPVNFTVATGQVRLTVRNTATQLTHNFAFTPGTGPSTIAEGIPLLAPGESDTIEFTVTAAGNYPFECSFHTALGQVGTMTVSGG
ncbi:Plastocyanin [Modestobacter sp. DSM 44400]|uniref:plastocyanin/azurin family copper-binding protein n=1 Tax=Modestobacter sp. DSM 44400 TaxID=1550230 RepID=UPI0008969C30|nr:plastocyanin/azurin family copper-binding protein [Modestobacter sp. DSM 44400]SDY16640.1 Plastocyanin [Modestobacter sp. DSM 44400]